MIEVAWILPKNTHYHHTSVAEWSKSYHTTQDVWIVTSFSFLYTLPFFNFLANQSNTPITITNRMDRVLEANGGDPPKTNYVILAERLSDKVSQHNNEQDKLKFLSTVSKK